MGGFREAASARARAFCAPFLDFLCPPVCFLCSDPLRGGVAVVCPACWSSFVRVDESHPVWRELEARVRREGAVDAIRARWLFEKGGALQEAVHLLKYRRARSVGVRMGADLGAEIRASALFASADLLVPVPLHPARRRERTYNQAELIARGAAEATGIRLEPELLVRTVSARSQTLLQGRSRRANVAGAFALLDAPARECPGKRIILVDDVMTTGATLVECARLLRAAGAASVLGACAALAR